MFLRNILFITFAQFLATTLSGQCPDKVLLWKRIVAMRDAVEVVSPQDQLKELLESEQQVKKCSDNRDSVYALLISRIGALYSNAGDFDRAIAYTKLSIQVIRENAKNKAVNLQHAIRSYNNLRYYYKNIARPKDEMQAIDSCISLAIQTNSFDRFSFFAYLAKLDHYIALSDYARCIEYAEIVERLAPLHLKGKDSIENVLYCAVRKFDCLQLLNRVEEADKMITEKIRQFSRKGITRVLGVLYSQMAQTFTRKGEYAKAIDYFNRALLENRRDTLYLQCAEVANNIGFLYFKQLKNNGTAMSNYRNAIAFLRRHGKYHDFNEKLESLNIYSNMATAFNGDGKYDSADFYYRLALDQVKPGITEKMIGSDAEALQKINQGTLYFFEFMSDKADASLRQYRNTGDKNALANALQSYRVYDRLIDYLRDQQVEAATKLFWRDHARHLYENAIETAYLLNDVESAFYFLEKSRASLLYDELNNHQALREKEFSHYAMLKRTLLKYKRVLDTMTESSAGYAVISDSVFMINRAIDQSVADIKIANPLYYQSFLDSFNLSVEMVRKLVLSQHSGMIEIFSGDSAWYILAITEKNSTISKIPVSKLKSLVNYFNNYLDKNIITKQQHDGFIDAATSLYKLLFESVKIPAGRIYISQDISSIPFEALIMDPTAQPVKYMLSDYAITYTYSARYLLNTFASNKSGTVKDFVGFAPVTFSHYTSLPELQLSDQSLKTIGKNFEAANEFIGSSATRANFLKTFNDYRLIHLYAHAADSSANHEPIIYFSDSALYLSDLINETMPLSQLIVLSACETGSGRIFRGEGVFSFNRGFAALGIPAAVANLWTVENLSTYQLTELFYKKLAEGMPTDIALQKAKIEFIAKTHRELPFYWAAPVLTGKAEVIEIEQPIRVNWWLVAIGAGLIFGIRYFFMLKKRLPPKARNF